MFNQKRQVDILDGKTKNVLSVFTQVVSDLKDLAAQARQQNAKNTQEIAQLQSENERLSNLAVQNDTVVGKIENLLA